LSELGPLYHNYLFFNVHNQQIPGSYAPNQIAKSQIITAYIAYALADSKKSSKSVSFAELFCADGYYAMIARSLGCAPCYGIDNNRDFHFTYAPLIAEKLGLSQIHFINRDIESALTENTWDIVANVGGLYHTEDPVRILQASYNAAHRYLIVQTVVSLANTSSDYFESPAPGWTWGSRHSRTSFDAIIRGLFGDQIVLQHFNELIGNSRLEDRGNVCYLIKKHTD